MSMTPSSYVIIGAKVDPKLFDDTIYEKLELFDDIEEYVVVYSEKEKVYYVGYIIADTDIYNYMFDEPIYISNYLSRIVEVEDFLYKTLDLKYNLLRVDIIVFSEMG